MMKSIKKIEYALLIGLLMIFILSMQMPVLAAGKIDLEKDAALTVSYKDGDTAITGAELDIYYIASVNEYGELSVNDTFAAYDINIAGKNDELWRELADALNGYVLLNKIVPTDKCVTDSNGAAVFPNQSSELKPGLYLVTGPRHSQDGNYYDVSPFIIMLPTADSETNEWNYNISVNVKYETVKIPDEPTLPLIITRKVLKVWNDEGAENDRPGKVTVYLLKDGEIADTVELNNNNSWRYTWNNLDIRNKWDIVEQEDSRYYSSVRREGITYVITNTRKTIPEEPEKINIDVLKIWDDSGNESYRPEEITVRLLRNGIEYDNVTLNQDNNWRFTWIDLDGNAAWDINEVAVDDYQSSISREGNVFVITNIIIVDPEPAPEPGDNTTAKTVMKVWEDKGNEDNRPDTISVNLMRNGSIYDTVVLSEENHWTYTWEKLDADSDWYVEEQAIDNYGSSISVSGNVFIITNTYTPEEIIVPDTPETTDIPPITDNPEEPDEPSLPQTGQLWWPVPVFTVVGLVFIIIGLVRLKSSEYDR